MKPRQNFPEMQRALRGKPASFQNRIELQRALGRMASDSRRKFDVYRGAEEFAHRRFGAENAGIVMDEVKEAWQKTKGKPPEEFEKRVKAIIGKLSKPAHSKYMRL